MLALSTSKRALELELPQEVLNRLAGKFAALGPRNPTALVPEGYELHNLSDGRVGLRMVLPDSTPLTLARRRISLLWGSAPFRRYASNRAFTSWRVDDQLFVDRKTSPRRYLDDADGVYPIQGRERAPLR